MAITHSQFTERLHDDAMAKMKRHDHLIRLGNLWGFDLAMLLYVHRGYFKKECALPGEIDAVLAFISGEDQPYWWWVVRCATPRGQIPTLLSAEAHGPSVADSRWPSMAVFDPADRVGFDAALYREVMFHYIEDKDNPPRDYFTHVVVELRRQLGRAEQ